MDISDIPIENLASRLTLATCEVDGFEEIFSHLDKIIIARVISVKPHPDADRLHICQVDIGDEKIQIVTGAENIRENVYIALAPVGSEIPGPEGVLKIKKAKLRGVESSGMMCSVKEMGLEDFIDDNGGIIILDDENDPSRADTPGLHNTLTPGSKISDFFPLKDTIIDIDNKSITHRPDLWCHFGFAREIAALYRREIRFNPLKNEVQEDSSLPEKEIIIEDDSAKAYFGAFCSGVAIAPSPIHIRARLSAIGQRPINNIVDATNYLMFELGQPNHAFDASELKSDKITVARHGHSVKTPEFTTLDEIKREIPEGSVMIMDGDASKGTAVALGGIMGGLHSGINDNTTRLFLESATFHREHIRRTVSGTQLRTDSSMRFEKGQDPAKARPALHRLVTIVRESCPDAKLGPISGHSPESAVNNIVHVSLRFLRSRLGFEISDEQVRDVLARLHFEISDEGESSGDGPVYKIVAPTFRSQYDVSIPEDIVEELGRIHGYDNIDPVPPHTECLAFEPDRERMFERMSRDHFIRSGAFHETRNYSFASKEDNELFKLDGLKIVNPVMSEQDRMRVSQIPGILRQLAFNQDRFENVRLMELGRVFLKDPNLPKDHIAIEERRLSLSVLSERIKGSASRDDEPVFRLFLTVRSLIESYLEEYAPGFTVENITRDEKASEKKEDRFALFHEAPYLHPGCAVRFKNSEGTTLGYAGILHPGFEQSFDLKRPAVVADLFFDTVYQSYENSRKAVNYEPPSVFPDSDLEFTVVVDEEISTAGPVETIRSLNIAEVQSTDLLTVYRGEPLPSGKKAVSYRVKCAHKGGTLSGDEVQGILERMIEGLKKSGYPLR